MVSGELASGKTALLEEFAETVLGSPGLLLTATATGLERSLHMGLLAQLFHSDRLPAGVAEAAAGLIDAEMSRARSRGTDSAGAVDAAVAQGLCGLLLELARTAPLVITIDDVQHADCASLAALLRVPHLVLAVNKMDLVDYAEPVFAAIAAEFTGYASSLGITGITAIPVSALVGDNVVEPSANLDWYAGPTLLEHLETVPVGTDPSDEPARFPVQYVIRPQTAEHPDYRSYAGQLASGVLCTGDPVTVLPSGHTTTIAGIDVLGVETDIAWAPQSIAVRLSDDLDISRGDLIAAGPTPVPGKDVEATVCHLNERPLKPGDKVLLKHTTRTVRALVKDITHRIDITASSGEDGLQQRTEANELNVNEIGGVTLRTAEPLALDAYADNRRTGSFLLIDAADGTTLTAGMAGQAFGTAHPAVASERRNRF